MINETKMYYTETGSALVRRFCAVNKIIEPRIQVKSREQYKITTFCAYYRPAAGIVICPDRCALPGHAGRQWSYPGHWTDRTPHGVIAHELGHHVDVLSGKTSGGRPYTSDYSAMVRLRSGEKQLTSYCPNDGEWFAEMFRLFATNPDLLRIIRPQTYALLRILFVPAVNQPWNVVLADAPARTIDLVRRKITTLSS